MAILAAAFHCESARRSMLDKPLEIRVSAKTLVDVGLLGLALFLFVKAYAVAGASPRIVSAWALAAAGLAVVAGAAIRALWLPFPRKVNAAMLLFVSVGCAALGVMGMEARGRSLLGLVDAPLARLAARAPAAPVAESAGVQALDFGRPPDLRQPDAVLQSLRDAGIEAYRSPTIHFLLDAADAGAIPLLPLGGIANAVTVHCNEADQPEYPVVRSDRFGFNNDDTVYGRPGERVVLLGDSYVYGFCVHQEQTIAGVLRRQGVPAISLGVGGNGPLLNLAVLREYGRAVGPKAVYWFYFDGNDLTDLADHELRSPQLRRYLDPSYSQGLAARQAEVDTLWRGIFSDRARWEQVSRDHDAAVAAYRTAPSAGDSAAAKEIRAALKIDALDSLRESNDVSAIMAGILGLAKRDAEALGAEFILVVVRGAAEYRAGRKPDHLDSVLAAARRLGIAIIDVDSAIRAGGPDRYFPRTHASPHYNAAGYALFAKAIAESRTPKGGIQIVEATFGLNCKDFAVKPPNVNVIRPGNSTSTMAAECNGKQSCEYTVGNAKVGGEPADGCSKDFNASWRCGGSGELKTLHLPDNAEGQVARPVCG